MKVLTADGMAYDIERGTVIGGPMSDTTAFPVGPLRDGLVNAALDGKRVASFSPSEKVVSFSESTATLEMRDPVVDWKVAFVFNDIIDLSDYVVWVGDKEDFQVLDIDGLLAEYTRPEDTEMDFITLETFEDVAPRRNTTAVGDYLYGSPTAKKEDKYPKGFRPPYKPVTPTSRPMPTFEPVDSFAELGRRDKALKAMECLDVSMV